MMLKRAPATSRMDQPHTRTARTAHYPFLYTDLTSLFMFMIYVLCVIIMLHL